VNTGHDNDGDNYNDHYRNGNNQRNRDRY
jgi:hypothetical protein